MKTFAETISSSRLVGTLKLACLWAVGQFWNSRWCLGRNGTERETVEELGSRRSGFTGPSTLPLLFFLGFPVGFFPVSVPNPQVSHIPPLVARSTLTSTFSPVPRETLTPTHPSIPTRDPGPDAGPVLASSATPFYKGRTVRVIVPVSPGGSFDLWARLLARHLGKHLPGNPTFIVQNMSGGGGASGSQLFIQGGKARRTDNRHHKSQRIPPSAERETGSEVRLGQLQLDRGSRYHP